MREFTLAVLGLMALVGAASAQGTSPAPPNADAGSIAGAGVGGAGIAATDGAADASRPNPRPGMVGGAGGPGGAADAGRAGSLTGVAGGGATTEGGGAAVGPTPTAR